MVRAVLAAAAIAAYFCYVAWPGLLSGFNVDDLMNMHFAVLDGWGRVLRGNFLFFSTQYRPLGGLYYIGIYELFGMNSLPFRVVGIAFLAFNMWLAYAVARALSTRVEAGLYAALILAWHGNFAPLFYGSGNIYDVLGFTFWMGALLWFLRCRAAGPLTTKQIAVLALLQILALNSKEFTATLPVVLLAADWVYHRRAADWRAVGVSVLLSGMYTAGKVLGRDSLVQQDAYAPRLSVDAYLTSLQAILNDLFYVSDWATPAKAVLFAIVLCGTAALLRNRAMWVACAIALLGTLPVMLITPRGLAAHYLAVGGLAIWAGALITDLRERFTSAIQTSSRESIYVQSALFAVVFAVSLKTHLPEVAYRQEDFWKTGRPIAQVIQSLSKHPEWFADPKRRILVVSDPLGDSEWDTVFAAGLTSHRRNLQMVKLSFLKAHPDENRDRRFDLFLHWNGTEFVTGDSPLQP